MFRVAIQVKEIISSNVTSALDGATSPAKMLRQLLREVEESIIAVQSDLTRARRGHDRLDGELTQAGLQEANWNEKARIAMDHRREDLARQALLAREDCRVAAEKLRADRATLASNIAEMEAALAGLEAKRIEVRQRLADQQSAENRDAAAGSVSSSACNADRHLDRIARAEQRTNFAVEDVVPGRDHAAVDGEIEAMRRESAIAAELQALRDGAPKAKPPMKPRRKAK